jgi:predicted DNA-binding transcriptional regulator AlpA
MAEDRDRELKTFSNFFGRHRDRLISEKVAAEILGISADTLRRLGKRGEGPKRRKISPRRVGYKLSEVESCRDAS